MRYFSSRGLSIFIRYGLCIFSGLLIVAGGAVGVGLHFLGLS